MALESPSNSLGSSLQLGLHFRSFMQSFPQPFHGDARPATMTWPQWLSETKKMTPRSPLPYIFHSSASTVRITVPLGTSACSRRVQSASVLACCCFPGPGRLPGLLFLQIQSLAGWDLVLVALIQLFQCRAQVSLRALIFLTITASFRTCPGYNSN